MISPTAEYALRAVICLGKQPDQPMTTQQIAELTHVPAAYLSKVLQGLGRAGLVRSQRGIHGGFNLKLPLADLTVLDVVNAVDPLRRIGRCPLELEEHRGGLCALHRRLDQAVAEAEGIFSGSVLGGLLGDEEAPEPLGSPASV